MKRFFRITIRVILIIIGIVTLFLFYVQFSYKQKYSAPVIDVKASRDSAVIARGKYLIYGPAHCSTCHVKERHEGDASPALTGGKEFKTPFGTHFSANLTPDDETGIGNVSDEEIARAIRYNINHKGYAMPAYMTFNNLVDEDLTSIVSYLRSTAPVKNNVPDHDLNIGGKILMRFVIKPIYSESQVPKSVSRDTSATYGEYLALSVANCNGCHTKRDPLGKFVGPKLGGGTPTRNEMGIFTPPNLTPDSTGRIFKWTAGNFINRFRAGEAFSGSPMPWRSFSSFSDNDLKAIYYYLQSLQPVKNKVEKTFIPHSAEVSK